jgi:multidrug efflux pump subunit AcrB
LLRTAAASDRDDLDRVYRRFGSIAAGHGAGSEVRAATGITVFSGMLDVKLFGLFLTPMFYVALRT